MKKVMYDGVQVSKPKRNPPSLSEFLEIEDNDLNGPYDGQRPFVTGHNRYCHLPYFVQLGFSVGAGKTTAYFLLVSAVEMAYLASCPDLT